MFGTYYHTHWRAGEFLVWEWSTLPHATWNGSWKRRPALQLTGDMTEQSSERLFLERDDQYSSSCISGGGAAAQQ